MIAAEIRERAKTLREEARVLDTFAERLDPPHGQFQAQTQKMKAILVVIFSLFGLLLLLAPVIREQDSNYSDATLTVAARRRDGGPSPERLSQPAAENSAGRRGFDRGLEIGKLMHEKNLARLTRAQIQALAPNHSGEEHMPERTAFEAGFVDGYFSGR